MLVERLQVWLELTVWSEGGGDELLLTADEAMTHFLFVVGGGCALALKELGTLGKEESAGSLINIDGV